MEKRKMKRKFFTYVTEHKKMEDGTIVTTTKTNYPLWITLWIVIFVVSVLIKLIDIDIEVKAKFDIKPPSKITELLK